MEKKITGVLIILVVAFVVANMAFFTVDQTQQAIVVRLGKPVGDI